MPRLLLVLLLQVTAACEYNFNGLMPEDGLDCYSCNGVNSTLECHTVVTCAAENFCFTEIIKDNNRTNSVMGCKSKEQCPVSSASSSTQIPTQTSTAPLQSSHTTLCSDCCSQQNCNNKLCSSVTQIGSDDNQCHDDPVFNCAYVSTTFDICADVSHAKTVCKKFCNLCDLVDGMWAVWGAWSACDTTCGNGSTTRTRTCTNPSPAHGGSDCTGISSQTGSCNLEACPVHGGWSIWSAWGSCSNTCGIGLQRRDRSCSNPYPDRFGDHCFGDDKIYRTCFERACADGGWSAWSAWGTCSATCNGGQMTRTRTCTNPPPSQFGRDCRGNYMDYKTCSAQNCPAQQVAFVANTPTGTLVGSSPTFRAIVLNIGGGYNQNSGQFRAPVAGLYLFSMTLTASSSRTGTTEVFCRIYKNSTRVALPSTFERRRESSSTSVFIQLSVGDIVKLDCGGWTYIYTSVYTSFTGALIRVD